MYSLNNLIIISLSLLVVGLILGYLFALKRSSNSGTQRKLEEQLQKLETQQQDYQHKVTEHFSETAQLLNQLTDNYRDVHAHLAKGAQLLCDEHTDVGLQHLSSQPQQAAELDEASVTPPLDYAPKNGDDTGMLNEEFGLEKSRQDEAEHSEVKTPVAS